MKVGVGEGCDLGAVINERQLAAMIEGVTSAIASGAVLLCGGDRAVEGELSQGSFMTPTILEDLPVGSERV